MSDRKLVVELELGNDAVLTGSDLAVYLVKIADVLTGTSRKALEARPGQSVRDINGNRIGEWRIE